MSNNDYDDDELVLTQDVPEDEQVELVDEASAIEDSPEDDRKAYSKRVNKRIDKLTYERNIEREARAKESAELRAEIEALKQDRLKEVHEQTAQELEQRQKDLIQRKKDAYEIGDHDEQAVIDDELLNLKLKAMQQQPLREQQPQQEYQAHQETQPKAQADWQASNQWVFDEKQASRLAKANAVFSDLLADGYETDDPDLYVQLDKKLKRETPPPSGAVDRGQIIGNDDSKGFTSTDKAKMRDWGLDPGNAEHRKEWIKNKAR